MEVKPIQKIESETKNTDLYYCTQLYSFYPDEFFASDRLPSGNGYSEREKFLFHPLYALSY